jgi:hypothetical protein
VLSQRVVVAVEAVLCCVVVCGGVRRVDSLVLVLVLVLWREVERVGGMSSYPHTHATIIITHTHRHTIITRTHTYTHTPSSPSPKRPKPKDQHILPLPFPFPFPFPSAWPGLAWLGTDLPEAEGRGGVLIMAHLQRRRIGRVDRDGHLQRVALLGWVGLGWLWRCG